jgi:hypothetical protein
MNEFMNEQKKRRKKKKKEKEGKHPPSRGRTSCPSTRDDSLVKEETKKREKKGKKRGKYNWERNSNFAELAFPFFFYFF